MAESEDPDLRLAELEQRLGESGVLEILPQGSWLGTEPLGAARHQLSFWLPDTEETRERETRFAAELQATGLGTFRASSERDDWAEAWKKEHAVLEIAGLSIRCPFHAEAEDKKSEIVLEPGEAFGLGGHPSTRLVLELLAELDLKSQRVLDVGCGTGILAFAALRFEASCAVGCDIHEAAIEEAHRNAKINGFCERVELRVGGPESLSAQAPFDLIIANIVDEKLIPLLDELRPLASPTTRWLLGGIRDSHRDVFEAAANRALSRWEIEQEHRGNAFSALTLRPRIT